MAAGIAVCLARIPSQQCQLLAFLVGLPSIRGAEAIRSARLSQMHRALKTLAIMTTSQRTRGRFETNEW